MASSYDLHGLQGPGHSGFRRDRTLEELTKPCPRCGQPARLDVVEVTYADGARYRQTYYRCPNVAKRRGAHAAPGRPKSRPEQHPIYSTKVRIDDVPKIDQALRESYNSGVADKKFTRNIIAERAGLRPDILSAVLSGANASQERLDAVANAIEDALTVTPLPIASGPGLGLRSEALEAEATRSDRQDVPLQAQPPAQVNEPLAEQVVTAAAEIDDVPQLDQTLREHQRSQALYHSRVRSLVTRLDCGIAEAVAMHSGMTSETLRNYLTFENYASDETIDRIEKAIEPVIENAQKIARFLSPSAPTPTVYQLAEQIEQLVRELLPQDPQGLLLYAAIRRGGWNRD